MAFTDSFSRPHIVGKGYVVVVVVVFKSEQAIKVNWAYASSQREDTSDDGQENPNEDAPENNPQYTTVYVGKLAPEVTSVELHRHFYAIDAGIIEDVRVQRDKGFGFVIYSARAEAAMDNQLGKARSLCGKPVKPTPPVTSSTPFPPPVAASMPGFSAADLAAYERQMAVSKMGVAQALMIPLGQHAFKAAMRMGAGASQAIYDGGYQNVATAQQLMYYQ